VRRFHVPAALLLLGYLAGCAAPPPEPARDPRINLTSSLRELRADLPIVTRDKGGSLHVSVTVHNLSARDVSITSRMEWRDSAGQPIRTTLRGNRRLAVPREGEITIDETAIGPAAVDFQMFLDNGTEG